MEENIDSVSRIIDIVKKGDHQHYVAAPWDPLTNKLANGFDTMVLVISRVIIDDRYAISLMSYSRNDFGHRWDPDKPWNDCHTYMWLLVQIDLETRKIETRHAWEIGTVLPYETKCCRKKYAIAQLVHYETMYLFDCKANYLGFILCGDEPGWLRCQDNCDQVPVWETLNGIEKWVPSSHPGDEFNASEHPPAIE